MAITLIAEVLLTLLKVILFLLLAVILVFLLIFCLVLFTPLKYNICAEKYDTIKAEGKVSWLLGIVGISFLYNDGESSYKLKIFGADYKKLAGFLARFFKKKGKKDYGLKAAEKTVRDKNESREENYEEKKETEVFPQKEENFTGNKDKTPVKENKTPQEKEQVEIPGKEYKKAVQHGKHSREDKDKRTSRNFIRSIKSFWEKIKSIPLKIKNIFNKISSRIKEFREKAQKIPDAVHEGTERLARIKEFIFSEITKDMFGMAKDKIFYLLKKIKPRKIKSDILIGTGDPCLTGQILGGIAVYMAMSGTVFNITPDFENKVLRGRLMVSGHIRAVTLVAVVLKIFISSEWKSFYKEAMKIKEEF